jgi:hypothetical protein
MYQKIHFFFIFLPQDPDSGSKKLLNPDLDPQPWLIPFHTGIIFSELL